MRLVSLRAAMFRVNKTTPEPEQPTSAIPCERCSGLGGHADNACRDCGVLPGVVRCPFHKVLMCTMAIFGLFNPVNFPEVCGRLRVPVMIYSTCVALFIVLNALRLFITVFDRSDPIVITFHKINYAAWFLMCAFNVTVFFLVSFSKKGGVRRYYSKVRGTIGRLQAAGVNLRIDRAWCIELPCIIVGWLLVIANSALVCRRLFDERGSSGGSAESAAVSPAAESEWLCRLWRSNDRNDSDGDNGTDASTAGVFVLDGEAEKQAMRYVMAVAVVLASGAWIWPVMYMINVAVHMSIQFKSLNSRMKKLAASDRRAFLADIGLYRQLHWKICKCVEAADDYFRYIVGVHIVIYLLLSMMEIYNLMQFESLRDSSNADLLAAYVIWLIAAAAMLAAECAASSVVAHESQETAAPLYKLADKCDDLDFHQLFQVQLFLSQLKDSSGFKVMGLFILNKEGLLAIFGTWVTYFLIVLQFAPPQQA